MSASVDALNNLPDINFVDKDVDTLLTSMIAEYQNAYQESTGKQKTLASGDPVRIWIYAQALRIYTAYQLIDQAAKNNLLKYSSGDYLENLGARIGVTRETAKGAMVTQQFTLSKTQGSAVVIPAGTRVSTSDNVFFATTQEVEIAAESTIPSVTVSAECTTAGTVGNGYTAGQINILVDPIQFVASTANITQSQGGVDEEDDEALRGRIFLKPESFSVAGPVGAYEYFTKEYSSAIIDVSVTSTNPGEVDVRFILENGELPDTSTDSGSAWITGVKKYLSEDTRRPLTDTVTVAPPDTVPYDINLTYYINNSDKISEDSIKTEVNAARSNYIIWQKSKIGRDINPSELIYKVITAGAKRVEVNAPVYTKVTNTQVAKEGTITVTYGGLEDE